MDNSNPADFILPIAIAVISLGIGVSLHFRDFTEIFKRPKAILSGLAGQIFVLPLLAICVVLFWPIENIYKVGVILIAACPGGTMSNFVTYLLKGKVALSVSMTAFNSVIILFTIPLAVKLGMDIFLKEDAEISLPFTKTFLDIFLTIVLPVIAGITFNELTSRKTSEKMQKPVRIIVTAMLVAMVVAVLWLDENNRGDQIFSNLHLLIPLVALNLITMFGGYYFAGFFKLEHKVRFTIAIELGLQNGALAVFIASDLLQNEKLATVGILYGTFSFFSSYIIGYILKHYFKPTPQPKQEQIPQPDRA